MKLSDRRSSLVPEVSTCGAPRSRTGRLRVVLGVAVVGAVVIACGSNSSTPTPGGPTDPGTGGPDTTGGIDPGSGAGGAVGAGGLADAATRGDSSADPGVIYAKDPLPTYCVLDGGSIPAPPPVTGTEECPSDKNNEGCACPTADMTAPCWPGLRKNRNHGVCKDGVTTCNATGEFGKKWGKCEGATLPTAGATKGASACKCFSSGEWKIANTSPCFSVSAQANDADKTPTAFSGAHATDPTKLDANGDPTCAQATGPYFSADSLTIDCEGHFRLCFVLRAGKMESASINDCVMMEQCVETDYPKAGVEQALLNIGAWTTTTPAQKTCANQFGLTGGYGELTVQGTSILCEAIDNGAGKPEVFQRFNYCALKCSLPSHKADAECVNCTTGTSGNF